LFDAKSLFMDATLVDARDQMDSHSHRSQNVGRIPEGRGKTPQGPTVAPRALLSPYPFMEVVS
jgi:hypothetical protein